MNEIIPAGPGGWVWDGTQWTCCDGGGFPQPCPPGPPPFFPPPQGQPPWYPGANGGVSFSPPGSPPPNPIRGAFWWDGTALWMFDGAAWVGVGGTGGSGGGAFTGSQPPANPANGALWFNGTTMFIWDGNAWVPSAATHTYVQATAPGAPNPGDQWWDGAQMRIWDGSTWRTVGPGATVGPVPTTTEVFAITQPTSLTVPANAWDIITFTGTPQIDTMSGWNPANSKFTPNKAGVYRFSALGLGGGGAGAGVTGFAILKNDNGTFTQTSSDGVVAIQTANTVASQGDWVMAEGLVKMNGSTDFVRLFFFNSSQGLFYGAGTTPVLTGWLMP